jgi:5-methylcytosine-specific restriction endonuclease McrA
LKTCCDCGVEKPLEDFPGNKGHKDGLSARCRACNSLAATTWLREHPDAASSIRAKYRTSAKFKTTEAAYKARNRERLRIGKLAHKRRRRALVMGTSPVIIATKADIDARVALFAGRCAYCGEPYQEIDHLWALRRAGLHVPTNLFPACARCNRSKSWHTWYDWFIRQPFFDPARLHALFVFQIQKGY